MHEQIVVSASDLQFLTITCRHCNTSVTVDLNTEYSPESRHSPFRSPRECPRCNNSFDSAIPGAIDAMQRVYKALAGLGNAVTFAVPAPAPPAKP